jgi:hypothetical protein
LNSRCRSCLRCCSRSWGVGTLCSSLSLKRYAPQAPRTVGLIVRAPSHCANCDSTARRRRAIGSASLRQRRCSSSVRWQAALRGHRARASDAPGSAESHFVRREGDEDRWLPRRVARTPGSNAATLVRIILGLCAGGPRRVAV